MTVLFKVSTLSDAVAADAELKVKRPSWAVMHARPNFREHGQVLWADLLTALGHDTSSSLEGRAISHSEAFAFCWLAAANITDLVVEGAHLLPPQSLINLCTTTTATGLRTWLLYDVETCDQREEAEVNLGFTDVSLQHFLDVRASYEPIPTPVVVSPFPAVPDVHFLGFLDAVNNVLSSDDAALAIEALKYGRDQMKERLANTPEIDEHQLAMHLHEITSETNDFNEMMAIVKGAQLGAFACGWHARVDVARWAERGMVAGLSLNLTDAEWKQLSRQHRPHESAASALSTLGISVDALPDIRADEVADDGSTVMKNNVAVAVPKLAQHLLVAQHIYRALLGTGSDRFLTPGPGEPKINEKWAGRLLRLTTRDTGVVLRGWNASRQTISKSGWSHRLGVSITRMSS
jgi:hypothetical protein